MLACVALCCAAALPTRCRAQNTSEDAIDKVTAAFLLNFARYTEWPADRFSAEDAPVRIGVVGGARVTDYVRQIVAGKKAGGRPIEVVAIDPPDRGEGTDDAEETRLFRARVSSVHVVFLPEDARAAFDRIRTVAEEAHVLTVGRVERFVDRGGMLGLYLKEGRLVFDAHAGAMERAEVRVSSRVLRLAQRVEEAQR